MARRDGVLIDGRPDGPSRQLWEMAQARECAAGASPLPAWSDAFSCANMVNHPPSGTPASVCVRPLDLHADEQPALQLRIPTLHFRPAAAGAPAKQTVVVLARRDLADEEIWLDYKLDYERGPTEPWYAPTASSGSAQLDSAGPTRADGTG